MHIVRATKLDFKIRRRLFDISMISLSRFEPYKFKNLVLGVKEAVAAGAKIGYDEYRIRSLDSRLGRLAGRRSLVLH